jgi:hypothetical protein
MRKPVAIFLSFLLVSSSALAQRRAQISGRSSKDGMKLTYDLGASAGSYAGQSYSEINLGLNWYFADWVAWRNALFSRFGSGESTSGLDSSLRFEYKATGDTFGLQAFAGPGYRFASKSLSAAFAEAGVVFKVGGLSLGAGAKYMHYTSPGEDSTGKTLPKDDTSYFLILGGGGVL